MRKRLFMILYVLLRLPKRNVLKMVEMAMHDLPLIVLDSGAEGVPLTGSGFINIDHASNDEIGTKLRGWLEQPEQAQRDGAETGAVVRYEFSAERIMRGLKDYLAVMA